MTNVKVTLTRIPIGLTCPISELGGMSVQLGPMEFIMERHTNRKINDPLLDKYVGYKMLSPELSNTPFPVVMIPKCRPRSPLCTSLPRACAARTASGRPVTRTKRPSSRWSRFRPRSASPP